jgi:hypothetical protein
MEENRREPRLRTFKSGTASFGLALSVDCIIRNMSKTGACLELKGAVPNTFSLLIKPELIKRTCEVTWRSQERVGVRFK